MTINIYPILLSVLFSFMPLLSMDLGNVKVKKEKTVQQEEKTEEDELAVKNGHEDNAMLREGEPWQDDSTVQKQKMDDTSDDAFKEDESTVTQKGLKRTSADIFKSAKKSRYKVSILCQAIKKNNTEKIEALLKKPEMVALKNKQGIVPIYLAVEKGADYVDKIIDAMEAYCLMTGEYKKRSFLIACAKGHDSLITLFCKKYPELVDDSTNVQSNFLNMFNWQAIPAEVNIFLGPLDCATLSGKKEAVYALFKAPGGQKSDIKISPSTAAYAVRLNYLETLMAVIEFDRTIDSIQLYLNQAYERGCSSVVPFCITACSKKAQGCSITDLCFIAARKKDEENLNKLKSNYSEDSLAIFYKAAFAGAFYGKHFDLAQKILDSGLVNIGSPLLCNNADFMKGARLTTSTEDPLIYAIENGDKELVQFSMENKADVKVKRSVRHNYYHGFKELFPLTVAVFNEKFEIADILLAHGDDSIVKTTLDIVRKLNKHNAVKYLEGKKELVKPPHLNVFTQPDFLPATCTGKELHSQACNAAASGDLKTLQGVIAVNPAVFSIVIDNHHPLHCAVEGDQVNSITFLLEEVDIAHAQIKEAVIFAIAQKKTNSLLALVKGIANARKSCWAELLVALSSYINLNAVNFLKELTNDSSALARFFINCCLRGACERGDKEYVEVLLTYMPDLQFFINMQNHKDTVKPPKMTTLKVVKTHEIENLLADALDKQHRLLQSALQSLCEGQELKEDELPLIDNGDRNGKSLLIKCLEKKNLAAVKKLLAYGVNVKYLDSQEVPALVYAVNTDIKDFVELLVNAKNFWTLNEYDYNKAIVAAVEKGSMEFVKYLFEKYPKKSLASNEGGLDLEHPLRIEPFLHAASSKEMVRFLLSKRGSVDTKIQKPSWVVALSRCVFQIVPLLIKADQLPTTQSSGNFLEAEGALAQRALALSMPFGVQEKDHLYLDVGESAVLLNLLVFDRELEQYLKDPRQFAQRYKADSFSRGTASGLKLKTPLMYACIFGHRDVVESLVNDFPEEYIKRQDQFGRTALMYSLIYGNVDCALSLINQEGVLRTDQGANMLYSNHCGDGIHLKDLNDKTALFYAAYAARADYPEEIEQEGKKVQLSKLAYSKQHGALKVLEVLQKLGVEPLSAEKLDLVTRIAVGNAKDEHAAEIHKAFVDVCTRK